MTAELHPVEREQIMAYLDGELAPEAATAHVAAHLEQCSECRQLEADLRAVSQQMLTWNVEPAPAGLSDGITAALRAQSPQVTPDAKRDVVVQRARWWGMTRGKWILAGACAAAVALIFLSESTRQHQIDGFFGTPSQQAVQTRSNSESLTAPDKTKAEPSSDSSMARKEARTSPSTMSAAPAPAPPPLSSRSAMIATGTADNLAPAAPMIARTASLKISVKDFQSARAGVDRNHQPPSTDSPPA